MADTNLKYLNLVGAELNLMMYVIIRYKFTEYQTHVTNTITNKTYQKYELT